MLCAHCTATLALKTHERVLTILTGSSWNYCIVMLKSSFLIQVMKQTRHSPLPLRPKPAIVGTVNMDWQSYYTGLQAADAFTLYTFTHFFSIQLATVNIIFLKHQASSSNFKNLLSIRQAQSSSKRGPFETDACPEGREGVAIRAREQQHLGREETLYTGTISKHWTHTHEIICHLHTCPVFGLFLLGKQHSMQQHGFIFERYTDRRCTCCILNLSINLSRLFIPVF